MNNGTTVSVTAQPNGDLTIENLDGTITIRKDGTISLSTLAPIELAGESLGKLDVDVGLPTDEVKKAFNLLLGKRGKRA
jgi:hypothetical protein